MKTHLLFSIFLFSASLIIGQERLTSFDQGGTNLNNHLKTVEGHHYLLQADQNDSLHIYELTSVDTKVYLHSKWIPGIHVERYPMIQKSELSYGLRDKFYVYDFVANVCDSIILPSGMEYERHSSSENGRHLLRLKDANGDRISYVFHNQQEGFLLDDKSYLKIYEEYVVEGIYEEGNYSTFVLHNYINGEIDTIAEDIQQNHRPIQVGNLFYFLDGNGLLYGFNTVTRVKRQLPGINIVSTTTNTIRLREQDGILYIGHSKVRFQAYDISTEMEIRNYVADVGATLSGFDVYNDVIVGRIYENRSKILLLNLLSGQFRVYTTFGGTRELVDDRYIFHLSVAESGFGGETLALIDVNNFEEYGLNQPVSWNTINSAGGARFSDKFVVVLNNNVQSSESIFEVDLPSKNAQVSESLDETIEGFSTFADYFPFRNGVIIEDGALYYLNDQLTLLQENDRHYALNYAFNSDRLFFESNDREHLLSFDGQQIEVVLDSLTNSDNIVATDNAVYFSDSWNNTLSQINLSTGQVSIIHENLHRPELFVFNNEFYYSKLDSLFKVDSNLNRENLLTEFFSVSHLNFSGDPAMVRLGTELIVPTFSGLMRLRDDGTKDYLLQGRIFDDYPIHFLASSSGRHLIFGSADSLFHYDGLNLVQVQTNTDIRGGFRRMGEDNFISESSTNDIYTTIFYNAETKDIQEIVGRNEFIVSYFVWTGETRVLTRKRIGSHSNDYNLFDLDQDFDQMELKTSFTSNSGYSFNDVILKDDKGLLAAGTILVKLNSNGHLVEVDDIRIGGDFKTKDDIVYFMGRDDRLGRQMYSYDLNLSSTVDKNETSKKIIVYPNPVDATIHFDFIEDIDMGLQDLQIEVFSSTGRSCAAEIESASLDVSHLTSGFYYLLLTIKDQRYTAKFVKN